jgi:hypothetical protein
MKKFHFMKLIQHILKAVAAPLTVKQTEGCSWNDILEIFAKTDIPNEAFDLWKGYIERHLFTTKADVKRNLETYRQYVIESKTPADVKNMVSCIAFEIKNFSEKYDIVGILMALAQNGGVCNVQKEIGIRTVYAAMMDSMMEHMKEKSIETKVLTLLKKSRFVLSGLVAEVVIRKTRGYSRVDVLNSHWVIPIQNVLAPQIGIDHIPDEHGASTFKCGGAYEEFMKRYDVDYLVRLVSGAVNDSHRLINYHDCVEFFEEIKPDDVETYAYLNDFVFDMETGKFTVLAIKYLLWKLDIIQVKQEVLNEHSRLLQKKKKVVVHKKDEPVLKSKLKKSKGKPNKSQGKAKKPAASVQVLEQPERRDELLPLWAVCIGAMIALSGLHFL